MVLYFYPQQLSSRPLHEIDLGPRHIASTGLEGRILLLDHRWLPILSVITSSLRRAETYGSQEDDSGFCKQLIIAVMLGGHTASKNSITPSRALCVRGESVFTTIPGCTGHAHEATGFGDLSTSTRHMRPALPISCTPCSTFSARRTVSRYHELPNLPLSLSASARCWELTHS